MNNPPLASTSSAMPSSVSSGSTDYHRKDSEAGPGFTPVNISPPPTRGMHEQGHILDRTNGHLESSPTSPDISPPRHSKQGAGRSTPGGHEPAPYKRKRSSSESPGSHSPRRYDYNPPRKEQQQQMADRALHVMDSNQQHPYFTTMPEPVSVDRPSYGYESPETPEGRLQDAFRQERDEQQRYGSSVGNTDHEQQDQQVEDGAPQMMGQTLQKRKRNFSNRTKTGCITCRQRKKKCDEGRPFCNNCQRGGFPCQGYAVTRPGTWTKPMTTQKPIALQSKETDEHGNYTDSPVASANPTVVDGLQRRPMDGHEQTRPQYAQASTPAESRPPYSGHSQSQPQHSWPQHQQHGPATQQQIPDQTPQFADFSQSNQTPSQQSQPPPPPHQQHYQPQQRQDYHQSQHQLTSSRDMSRANPQSTPQPSTTTPVSAAWHQPQPPPQTTPQSQPQYQTQQQQQQQQPAQEYRQQPFPPPRIDTSQPATHPYPHSSSRMSSSYTASSYNEKMNSKVFSAEEVERSRMLRGAQYNYFDQTLRNERARCSTALARYNAALALTSGVSQAAAQDMLSKVFDPSLDTTHSFRAPCKERGILGPGVIIEENFKCTYGYNIRLGDNVFVGHNVTIDDSAKVNIGARSWIGANVTILTNDILTDIAFRKGTDGQPSKASPVDISSECVIGCGAVIFPGVKLGRGCTVEPFAVVKHDLGEFIVQKVPVGAQMSATSG